MKPLEQVLPEGLLVNREWLREKGFDRPTVDYYLRSGKLVPVCRGIYRKPGPQLKWEHVVWSYSYSYDDLGNLIGETGFDEDDLPQVVTTLDVETLFGGPARFLP